MSSFCDQCGAGLADGANFCEACGTKVPPPEASDEPVVSPAGTESPNEPPAKTVLPDQKAVSDHRAPVRAPGASPPNPWFYGAANSVAAIAMVASILSVIGGIVIGIELSKYTGTDEFGLPATHHHGGVVAYWIAIGVFTAAVWMALAVGLKLLADIGASLRGSSTAARYGQDSS